jgi:branched-chain amino acid transport system permease protein
VRALSLGVDTRRYTLMAFAIGAGLGGISGVLYAPLVQYIDPSPFALLLSLNLLLMVIVGGSGYFFGPFLGAVVAVLLPEWLQSADKMYDAFGPLGETLRTVLPPEALKYVSKHYLVVYALFVMVLLVFSPSGILGLIDRRFNAQKPAAQPAPAIEAKAAS